MMMMMNATAIIHNSGSSNIGSFWKSFPPSFFFFYNLMLVVSEVVSKGFLFQSESFLALLGTALDCIDQEIQFF